MRHQDHKLAGDIAQKLKRLRSRGATGDEVQTLASETSIWAETLRSGPRTVDDTHTEAWLSLCKLAEMLTAPRPGDDLDRQWKIATDHCDQWTQATA
jgi:hypothetical protein